jgi:hypothetical protein
VLPPNPRFRHFSFVQDMLPYIPTKVKHGEIAQPLVLFKTFCIATFATSPLAASLTHVRLRIPQRSILTSLAASSTSTTVLPLSHGLPRPFPSLEYLDISTTFVPLAPAFSALLRRHGRLRHLVLDRTGIASDSEGVQQLGKTCASYGIGRKKEVERILRAKRAEWEAEDRELENRRRGNAGERGQAGSGGGGDRATAARAMAGRTSRRRMGRSGFNSPPASFYRDNTEPEPAPEGAGGTFSNMRRPRRIPSQVLIVPLASSLATVSCGVDSLSPEARLARQEAFSRGWAEGREAVVQVAEEVMASYQRAVDHGREEDTVLARFLGPGEEVEQDDDRDDDARGLFGSLSVVPCSMAEARAVLSAVVDSECIFCSIPDCPGQGTIAWALTADVEEAADEKKKTVEDWRRDDHVEGCGHLVGKQEWEAFQADGGLI